MKFTLLLTAKPDAGPSPGSDDWSDYASAFGAWNQAAVKANVHRGGEPVLPPSSAKTVRKANGKLDIVDGAPVEHPDAFIGWYLIECDNIDEAVEWASKLPLVERSIGTVEVRPVADFS